MFRFLIVHDRETARADVEDVCRKLVPGAAIDVAPDYVAARRLLGANLYDVAVIDLTLPHRTGEAPSYTVAASLLKEIIELDDVNTPGDIIGITFDVDALAMVNTDIGHHLMSIIPESSNSDWRKLLSDRISYSIKSRESRLRSASQHFDLDVCIVTALDKEVEPYSRLFELYPDPVLEGVKNFVFSDGAGHQRRAAIASVGRAGQPRSASLSQGLLNVFRPRLLLMSGICGGVRGRIKIGDVAIFETVYDWDYGKWKKQKSGGSTFHSRPEPIGVRDQVIHRVLREFVSNGTADFEEVVAGTRKAHPILPLKPNVYLVPAASGSAIVGSEEIISKIGNLNDSICAVDMESYGMYASAVMTNVIKPEMICIKAVSDYCDGSKNDRWHESCCELSARTVAILLKRWYQF